MEFESAMEAVWEIELEYRLALYFVPYSTRKNNIS